MTGNPLIAADQKFTLLETGSAWAVNLNELFLGKTQRGLVTMHDHLLALQKKSMEVSNVFLRP